MKWNENLELTFKIKRNNTMYEATVYITIIIKNAIIDPPKVNNSSHQSYSNCQDFHVQLMPKGPLWFLTSRDGY